MEDPIDTMTVTISIDTFPSHTFKATTAGVAEIKAVCEKAKNDWLATLNPNINLPAGTFFGPTSNVELPAGTFKPKN